jgi:hypothetical protein
MAGGCWVGDDDDLLFVPLKQWTSLIIGAWRTFTEISLAGFGGGGGAAPFLLVFGEIEGWWSFCSIETLKKAKLEKKEIFIRDRYPEME